MASAFKCVLRLGYFILSRVKERKENRVTSYMQSRICLTKSHFLNLQGTLPKKPIRCSNRQVFFCKAPGSKCCSLRQPDTAARGCRPGCAWLGVAGGGVTGCRKAEQDCAPLPADCQLWNGGVPPRDTRSKGPNKENEHSNQRASFLMK